MYYITKKSTETGRKFQALSDQIQKSWDAHVAFSDKYKFKQWRGSSMYAFGDITACIEFEEEPDLRIWKKGQWLNSFTPKKNTKEGKAIAKEIEDLPKVSKQNLNMCIGYNGDRKSVV